MITDTQRLAYGIADAAVAGLYPKHGWATNSQGVKILWLPLWRIVVQPDLAAKQLGMTDHIPIGCADAAHTFGHTMIKLVTDLRELHCAVRSSCALPVGFEGGPDAWTIDLRVQELVPLYVELAIIYLRRIPDLLASSCRFIMFKHWQSVSMDFKDWIANVDNLASHKPMCDFMRLKQTIVGSTTWFNALRGTSQICGMKGIRDALEHRPVRLLSGKQQAGNDRPVYRVQIDSKAKDVETGTELLNVISASVEGLANLMTGIHGAIGVGSRYEWGDFVARVGDPEDVVGYWPAISA